MYQWKLLLLRNQSLYFNGGIGAMNYGGDLQEKKFTLKECNPSLTVRCHILFFTPNFLGNLNFTYGKIGAADAKNGIRWIYRNLDFKSNIFEAAVTAEYDLFDIRESAIAEFLNTEQANHQIYTLYFCWNRCV